MNAPRPDSLDTEPNHEAVPVNDHHQHLSKGFNWLGGATIIAKIIDFSTILVMLLYLTKEQVGVASLVVSIGMVVEALNGLGTSEALIQTRSVSRLQLDTLFWYVIGAAILVSGLVVVAAPYIQMVYGVDGMKTYFLAIAVKQPLVGAALIPLAIMNKQLQYERVAIVSVCATLAAAVTRMSLGASGAGVWALVAGYSTSGLYTLIGAYLARPFRPGLQFQFTAILPLVRFGIRAGTSNLAEQMFKNVDYLLVGWFYGASQLAIYRVAFDVAMEPAMAIGTVINRTALPVFARVSTVRSHLMQTLTWSLRKIATLVVPLMVALILVADPLMSLIHDHQGGSYVAAAGPLKLLAAAALFRITLQLLSTMMVGTGSPGAAVRISAATLLLLSMGITTAGLVFRAHTGIIAVSAIWLGIYPLLLAWAIFYLRRHWDVSTMELARAFSGPFIGIAMMVLIVETTRYFIGFSNIKVEIGLVALTTIITYAGLAMHERRRGDLRA